MNFHYEVQLRNKTGTTLEILQEDVVSVSWSYNSIGGCGECEIALAREFDNYGDIDIDYDVQIWRTWDPFARPGAVLPAALPLELGGQEISNAERRYSGFVREITPVFDLKEKVRLRCIGYARQLEYIIVPEQNYLNQDVGAIVRAIIDTYVTPGTQIKRTASLALVQDVGIVAANLRFDASAWEAIKILAEIGGNAEWGVRPDKEIYFVARSAAVKQTIVLGDRVKYYETPKNSDELINRVYLRGASGFSATLNNGAFQSGYQKERAVFAPFIVTAADATLWANAFFARFGSAQARARVVFDDPEAWIENTAGQTMPPLGRFRILGGAQTIYGSGLLPSALPMELATVLGQATDVSYRIDAIRYTPTANGLEVEVHLGEKGSALADLLRGIEFKLSDARMNSTMLDKLAPSAPASVAISSHLKTVAVQTTYNLPLANTDRDFAGVEIELWRTAIGGAGTLITKTRIGVSQDTAGSGTMIIRRAFALDAESYGAVIWARARSLDIANNPSDYVASASGTTLTALANEEVSGDTPTAPTGLALGSTGTYVSTGGGVLAFVNLTWTVPSDTKRSHFELSYRKNGSTELVLMDTPTDGSGRIDDLAPGVAYDFAVVAVSKFGVKSTSNILSNQTTPVDTTAPAAPATVTVASHLKTVTVEATITRPVEKDFAGVEIELWRTAITTGTLLKTTRISAPPDFTGSGTMLIRRAFNLDGESYGNVIFARVRSVDWSDNKSGNTDSASGTTLSRAATEDVADGALSTIGTFTSEASVVPGSTETDIASVTITTTGKTARIRGQFNYGINTQVNPVIKIKRGATELQSFNPGSASVLLSLEEFDTPAAGTYTYKITGITGSGTFFARLPIRMVVEEIKK